jgi:hypothetical protein
MNTTEQKQTNNIVENNKLIAEFMGLKIITDDISFFDTNYNTLKRYATVWNWLIEVVEKIESLGFEVTILKNECTIRNNCLIGFDFDRTYCVPTKIEAVYNACVEFIKWYNKEIK